MPPIEPPIYYFYLSTKVTVFEPMGPLNSVYYDDAGKHIFTLRSRGTMGVNVKSVVNDVALNFRIDDRGEILSIKFSEDNEILGIQRSLQSVDFLNFKNHCPNGVQYSQTCRNKSASLLGFVWCSNHEVLFVSNEQLELYQVLAEKNTVRLNKCLPLNTNWFLWNVDTRICLTFGSEESLHVFNLKTSGTISKGPKFQLSETKDMNGVATSLEHRHSFLALLYGNLYFCTLRYLSLNNNRRLTRTVCFYSLDMENPVSLTHVVLLDSEDCVSFSVLDDLFMVHYQNKKVSSVYDIALMGTMHNNVNHHKPILCDMLTAPFNLSTKIVPALSSKLETQFPIELYSTNRVINLCGIIIDNNLGCSWTLCLDNSVVPKLIDNHNLVVDFILHRFNGKSVLLDYFCELVATSVKEVIWMTDKPLDYTFNGCGLNQRLDQFAFIFKRICEVCYPTKVDANRLHTDSNKFNTNSFDKGSYRTSSRPHTLETSSQESLLVSSKCSIITQSEIFSHVFMKNQCMENLEVRKFFCSLLIEYIRIMLDHNVHIEHCFYELLVSLIARIGNYMQFGYYIQSRLLADSKPVALQLLSLESVYPAAGQLAIDMLKRTNTFNDELFDALLIKRRSLEALRFSRLQYPSYAVDTENICNFLNTTQKDQDFLQFYCAYHFLKEEGLNWKDLFKHTDGPYRCLVEHYIDRSY